MSVSALNNTNYYIPTISTKPASNEAASASSASAPAQVQQVDENNTKIQATPDSYAANQQNTSSNNSAQNNASSNAPVYTGEEMLSALNQDKQAQNSQTALSSQTAQSNQTAQSAQKQQAANTGEKVLTEEEQKQVEELKARDTEVKTHEQAHIAAGGSYVRGGASYDYQTGPDGKKYAVGGEVSIDTSAVEGDPQATINKAQVILKAALAPAEPSGQDKAVASQARQMMASARKELMSEKINTNSENTAAATTTENSTTAANNNKNVTESSNQESSTIDASALSQTSNTVEAAANTNAGTNADTGTNADKPAPEAAQVQAPTSAPASSENSKTENKAPVTVDTAPKMNTQSLKSDSVNIPQVNVAGSGLYQAFSNAGMSPIKNANALMQVAGSLISMMA